MFYDKAAYYFNEAWKTDPDREHLDAYLAAKRMELTEDAYVAFAAQNPENEILWRQLKALRKTNVNWAAIS